MMKLIQLNIKKIIIFCVLAPALILNANFVLTSQALAEGLTKGDKMRIEIAKYIESHAEELKLSKQQIDSYEKLKELNVDELIPDRDDGLVKILAKVDLSNNLNLGDLAKSYQNYKVLAKLYNSTLALGSGSSIVLNALSKKAGISDETMESYQRNLNFQRTGDVNEIEDMNEKFKKIDNESKDSVSQFKIFKLGASRGWAISRATFLDHKVLTLAKRSLNLKTDIPSKDAAKKFDIIANGLESFVKEISRVMVDPHKEASFSDILNTINFGNAFFFQNGKIAGVTRKSVIYIDAYNAYKNIRKQSLLLTKLLRTSGNEFDSYEHSLLITSINKVARDLLESYLAVVKPLAYEFRLNKQYKGLIAVCEIALDFSGWGGSESSLMVQENNFINEGKSIDEKINSLIKHIKTAQSTIRTVEVNAYRTMEVNKTGIFSPHNSIVVSKKKKKIDENQKQSAEQNSATASLKDKKTKAEKLWNKNHKLALKYTELIQAGKENTDEGKTVRDQLNETGAEYGALRAEIREQDPGYGSYYDTSGTVAKRTEHSRPSSEVADSTGTEQNSKNTDKASNTTSNALNEKIVEADKLYRKTADLAARYAELFKAGKENTAEGRKVRNLLNVTGKKYSNLRAEIRKQDPDYGLYGYFQGYNYPTSWTVEKSLEEYKQENSKQFNDTGSITTDAFAIISGRSWNELSKSEKVKLGILGRNYNVARGDSKDIIAWGYNVYELVTGTRKMPEKYDYKSGIPGVYTGQIASIYGFSDLPGMPNEYSTGVRDETTRRFQDDAQAEIIRQAEERRRLEAERERLRREEEQQRDREEAANNQESSDEPSSPSDTPPNSGVADNRGAADYAYVVNKPSRAPGDPGEILTFHGGARTVENYQTAPAIGAHVAMTVDCEQGQCTEDMTITGKYQYSSWGEWSGGADSTEAHFHGVVGIPTVTMPSTGTATYTGAVIGDYYDSNGPVPTTGPFPQLTKTVEVNAIGGTANITADFAGRSVSGELNLTHNGGSFADVYFNNLSITSTNGYHGSLSSATVNGSVDGGFAGPNAEETGGSFHVQRNDGTGAIGIFHARQ